MNCFSRFIGLFLKTALALLITVALNTAAFAQSGNCHPATPFFSIDLSADPNGVWTSPSVPRSNLCCGNTSPDRCIEFSITLSPQAVAINFQIASGAVPPGAMFYQINCGTPVQVGSPICLNGPGPYTLTFCKPGNNPNSYAITSIAAPEGSPDKTVGDGCQTSMSVSGLVTSTISWTSIFPGATGAYNSYLNCTSACTLATVTPASGHPPYVDYKVCGTPAAGVCAYPGQFCDTIRVYMSDPILNTITPNPASFCVNNPTITLTGNVNGGVAPYTYAWTNAANGGGTVVGNAISYTATATGTYSFIVYDQNYPACPASIVSIPVTSTPLPLVNAGADIISCGTSVNLSGTVTGATGGTWSGGAGGFMPGNTALTTSYTPTITELNSGTVVLTLTSTGNGACNAVSDQVTVFVSPPLSASINGPSVICSGQSVTLTANATGGTGPFTYLWNTGATTQTISALTPGSYSVTVKGAGPGFCTATQSKTLTANPSISVSTTPNNAVACADSITISASATGGAGSFTYLWSNGATTNATSVNTGTYTVTVTDAAGCSANETVSVTASNSLAATVNQPAIVCNGGSATLTVNATGGLGGFTYLWTNNATTTSITEGAGNYCVTVTDGGGCVTSACATITQNPPIVINIPTPATVCNGASATATATVSGGQAPYSFSWNSGQTTQSITATAGTYTLTVTDALNCTNTATVTISQATALVITPGSVAVGCFGGSNGSATATVSGGTPSYSYAWSPFGGTAATASSLTAGTYSVTVTDAMSCSTSASIIVSQPAVLSASAEVQNNVSCYGGSNGAATVTPVGGTGPFTYSWSPGGAGGQTVNTLFAGTYTITVTDNKGCITTTQATITQPSAALAAAVDTIVNVSCKNGSNGQVTITASGGTPAYTYLWAPGGATTAGLTGLTAGNYTVTVTDSKGCNSPLPVSITEPPVLTVNITGTTQITCNGYNDGTATATAGGGVAPYTYAWSTSPSQTTPVATNLPPGSYTVLITDANNCTVTSSAATITQPAALVVTASPTALISCDNSIAINSLAAGGTAGYNYLWSTGETTTSITVNTGSYIIVATDAKGCSASDTVSVLATNSTLAVSIAQPPNICNGTTISITPVITGGLGGNTYLWSTGATTSSIVVGAGSYCVTVTDAGGCIATGCVTVVENPVISMTVPPPPPVCPGDSATVTVTATGGQAPYSYQWNTGETTQSVTKPAGTYTIILTDVTGVGCAGSVSVTITEETPVTTTVSHTDVSCHGAANGSVVVYASGGSSGYTYSWAPSGATSASVLHLGPATYTVTVTDSLGCSVTDSVTVVQPLSPIALSVTGTNNLCFGDSMGTAVGNATGGSAPYYFLWTVTGDTINAISNLAAGEYIATVSDTSGCYTSDTIVITEPSELVLTATAQQFSCFGQTGSVTLVPSGGTPNYTITGSDTVNLTSGNYTYIVTDNNGCMDTATAVIDAGPPPFILTAAASQIQCFGGKGSVALSWTGGTGNIVISGDDTTDLVAGTYNYTATDSAGCTATAQAVIVPAPSAVMLSAIASQIECFGQTGSVQLLASGGVGAFTLSGDDTVNLNAGTYTYIATDTNGCADTTTAVINAGPPPFTLTATATTINCYGDSASVNLVASGGAGTLTYSGDDTTNLAAGTYNYMVTDTNGCTATAQAIIVPGPPPFILTAAASQILCFGGKGSVALSWTGGTGNSVISGDDTSDLVAGTYNYTATDSAGCTATAQAVIVPAPSAVMLSAIASQIECFGQTGSVQLLASGGVGAFTLSGDDTVNLNAGTYTYIATDTNGCADTTTAVINAGPPPFTLTATATTINCYGDSASVNLVASGGAGTLTYSGDDTTNLAAGTYNYTVTDTNGCIATAQVTVAPGPPLFTLSATTTQIACFGGTASVALNVTGGLGTIVITGDDTTNLYAGTYNYTATDSTGCTATVQAVIAAAPDSLIASITATQISCFGLNDGAATAVIVGGTSPYQFLWQTGATTASVTGLVQGTYSVGVMDDRGCTASDSVVISEPLEIVLSGTTVASTCGLNNGSATVSASGGTGTLTYSWAPYGGTAADADSLFADDYTVTVTDSSGCQQQTVLTVSSSSFLIANFGVSAGCQNSLTSFSDSSVASPGSTITSWAWDFGDSSPPDSLVNPSHAFINSGSQNVTLTITSSAGCNASVTLPVNVHALPAVDFTSTKVCAGMPTVFNDASTVAGDTISNWDWDFGETNASSTLENPLYTYSAPGDYTTTLIVTSGNGCKDTTNALVTVYANPVVQFSVDDSSGCVVHCPWFTDLTSLPGTSITSWQWNYGDGSPFGSNMTGEHCYTGSGSYTISLTVTTAQGCTSTGTQNNMITVYQLPTADFGFSPSSPVPLIAADIDFTNQSIGSSSWLWDFGDQNDTTGSNEQHPSHIYSDTGTYCITLIAMSNEQCADTIEYCLIVEPEFTFFIPNAFTPFDSQGTNDGFSGYGTNIKEYDMWIFDRWGNMIFHTSDLEVRWDGKANKGKEMAQRDVYVYLVKLVDFRGGEHQYRGTVTLVR